MSKHTPGPWFSERDKIGPRSQSDDQSYGMLMPVAYIELYDNPERAEGNKALITAAPELLEALESALKAWDRIYPDLKWNDQEALEDIEFREMQMARAAISKAKGEREGISE